MLSKFFDYTPSMDDEAPGIVFKDFPKEVKLRESAKLPPDTDSHFDDTFRDFPRVRECHQREAGNQAQMQPQPGTPNNQLKKKPAPAQGAQPPAASNPGQQPQPPAQAAPAGDPAAATAEPAEQGGGQQPNSDFDNQIIQGEHHTLMALGRMPEADPNDNHQAHNMQHRALLGNPDLSQQQRSSLMDHTANHTKMAKSKDKVVKNPPMGPEALPGSNFRPGSAGQAGSQQPQMARRTMAAGKGAGRPSMEARMQRFDNATKTAYGRR